MSERITRPKARLAYVAGSVMRLRRWMMAALVALALGAIAPYLVVVQARVITIVQKDIAEDGGATGTASVTLEGVGAGNAILIFAYTFNDTTWSITDADDTVTSLRRRVADLEASLSHQRELTGAERRRADALEERSRMA